MWQHNANTIIDCYIPVCSRPQDLLLGHLKAARWCAQSDSVGDDAVHQIHFIQALVVHICG